MLLYCYQNLLNKYKKVNSSLPLNLNPYSIVYQDFVIKSLGLTAVPTGCPDPLMQQ